MLRGQSSILFGLLLIFLMSACTPVTNTDEFALSDDEPVIAADSPPDSPEHASTEPPEATLTIDGRKQTAGITGYCWQRGDDTSICADGIGFTTAPEPIPAESTFFTQFEFRLDAEPRSVRLSIFPAAQPILMGPEENDWRYWKPVPGDLYTLPPNNHPFIELTKEPGLYVFNVFAEWADYGEVNYGFLVDVAHAMPQNSVSFIDDQGMPVLATLVIQPIFGGVGGLFWVGSR